MARRLAVISPLQIAGVAACSLALAWGLWHRSEALQARADLTAARVQLATAEARLSQAAEAVAVHRAHLARVEAMASEAAARDADILNMEGAHAPASDYLRRAVDRVR